ncbi:RNA polymerase sigma-70 factor [Hyunsoonleella flava]|uniref:RNA polymerase sigma-70 factor n=1 Tax=Hyunsoonleella flava TaxID=2527939 RepID=A0A4Q9FEY2_9FLAO|nr:RNA polymerase sigma-70 factor [Hyunsoonleella flava]TBN03969.1 RNA polymerase sigma-70 factor [Hyunsoonleella flava]
MGLIFDDNAAFVSKLKRGDEKAFANLVDKYNSKLCLYANSLLNDIPLSEDIVQNLFIKIWEKRDGLREDLPLKNYLYKSVYNACINQYKKNQALTALEKKYVEGLNRIVEKEDKDTLDKLKLKVKQAIENLPPKCKEVFILSKKDGLTNIEISEYLNISVSTIERHITIAFTKIRDEVGSKTEFILSLLFVKKKFIEPLKAFD